MSGCKTTNAADSIPGIITLSIQYNGNVYSEVLDLIRQHTSVRETRMVNLGNSFDYYEQIEVKIDFLDNKQLTSLQAKIFRIQGIVSVDSTK